MDKKPVCTHVRALTECYPAVEKKEILPLAMTRRRLEDITLSETARNRELMRNLTYMYTLKEKKSQIENKTAVTRGLSGQGIRHVGRKTQSCRCGTQI